MKSQLLIPYVYHFLEDLNLEDFDKMYDYAVKRDVPSVSRGVGALLSFFVKLRKPESVLELGCGIGVAAKFMLSSWNCKYTGVDNNAERLDVAKGFLSEYNNVTLIRDKVENFLLNTTEIYDFVFVDSIKKDYEKIWYLLKPHLKNGSIVIFDDFFLYGYLFQEEAETPLKYREGVRLIKRFIKNIKSEMGYNVLFIPVENGVMVVSYEC
ncbi:MAG: methyltransferase domain-containing protein [Deferribacterales bacterium]